MWILAVENLGCERLVAVVGGLWKMFVSLREGRLKMSSAYNDVDVSRSEWVSVHDLEKLAGRSYAHLAMAFKKKKKV